MLRRVVTIALTLAAVGLCAPRPGLAADELSKADEAQRTEALDLFEQSRQAYREGRFTYAAELLRAAYRLYPSPVLLFNLARAQESAGQDEDAVAAYQRYLQAEPQARDRGAIEQRIANIRQRLEETEQARLRAEAAEQQAQESEQPGLLWPSLMIGTGAAVLVTGVVFAGLAKSDEADAADEPTHAESTATFERGERNAIVATVTLVIGGAVTTGGLSWLIVNLAADTAPSTATVRLSPAPGGAVISGRF